MRSRCAKGRKGKHEKDWNVDEVRRSRRDRLDLSEEAD
jgi:hypothetical protein